MTDFPRPGGYPLSRNGRILLVAAGVFLLGVFAVAVRLKPDARGYGTHQSLGLPACSFQAIFHRPCPSCGMTTSFAHFVRGQWLAAGRANAGGLVLAFACAAMIPWSLASACTSRLWWVYEPDVLVFWVLLVTSGVTLIQWGIRLAL